jgi:hypothetical protein
MKKLKQRKKCYPENISISESHCQIPLQDLLDHSTKRIFHIPNIRSIENNFIQFEMLYKWGCDGSSGQSQYKQNFLSDDTSDSDIFMFSIVPIILRCLTTNSSSHKILWENPRKSSTKFCRPIKFLLKKETSITTVEEVNAVELQIKPF